MGTAEYTVDGSLFTHAYLGMRMVEETGKRLGTNPELIRQVMHVIAAHHGQLDWGAISVPATPEAAVVHYIDMIDSRVEQFEQVYKELEPGKMSSRVFGLGTCVYSNGINLITVIANILKPTALGTLFLYGTQGTATNLKDAKEKAELDFDAFIHAMQGTYKVLELRVIVAQESEWLREKMFGMDYLTMVRGIPKAAKAGEDAGNKGVGGKNVNPDSQGTLEELMVGMADYEYVIEILSTPVYQDTLLGWQARTQRDMTAWYGQLQGTKSLSMNLSVPMMYMANTTQASGWNKNYTDARTVSYGSGENYSVSSGENVGKSLSQSFGESITHSSSQSVSNSVSHGTSQTHGVSHSIGTGHTTGSTVGHSLGESLGISENQSLGKSLNASHGVSSNESVSEGLNVSHSEGSSRGQSLSQSYGHTVGSSHSTSLSNGTTISHNVGNSQSHGYNQSNSFSVGNSYSQGQSFNTGHTSGTTDGTTSGRTHGTSSSTGGSSSDSTTSGNSGSTSTSSGTSTSGTVGGSVRIGSSLIPVGGTVNASVSTGKNQSTSESEGWSNSSSHTDGTSWGLSSSDSVSNSASHSASQSDSTSQGTSYSSSQSYNQGTSYGSSVNYGTSESWGNSTSQSMSEGWGSSVSDSETRGYGESYSISNSDSVGRSTGRSVGTGVSDSYGMGLSQSQGMGMSLGQSVSDSRSRSESVSFSESTGTSDSVSQSETIGQSTGQSIGESKGSSQSYGYGQNYSESRSTSNGTSYSTTNGQSSGESNGTSGTVSRGTSSSMGLGPSIGWSKSYQWLDQGVKDLLELLEYQNERIKRGLRGNGAFYTYAYIACPTRKAMNTAQAVAKTTWQNEDAYVQPLQVLDLSETEQKHLLYHFNAFSADITREEVYGTEEYKYCTVLLSDEYVAYTHLPRVNMGGIETIAEDIPKFAVPAGMSGEVYMGNILNPDVYTCDRGYRTYHDYCINEERLMHGYVTGASRSGKTVTAMRFIAELSKVKRKRTGKKLRIVVLDPKQDWRALARFVEPERFNFYSLGKVDFRPIKINVWKIPKGVQPQIWIDGVIDIYCRSYGLLERGKQLIADVVYSLYSDAGVFAACDKDDWQETVPELSAQVNFKKIYQRFEDNRDRMVGSNKGGNDTKDAYSRLLERLSCFSREFSIESRLYGTSEGIAIDELIGDDDVTILESKGLENTFKNFIFGVVVSGFFKYALAHDGGFLADDQYETVMVIEEANEVLIGTDTAGGDRKASLSGESEFEIVLDQAAGYGLFIVAITQKIADMPSSVIANAGIVFAGRLVRPEDKAVVIQAIAREERIDNRDIVKWLPRMPQGWFICQSARGTDFKAAEPVLVAIDAINLKPMSNMELDERLTQKDVLTMIS